MKRKISIEDLPFGLFCGAAMVIVSLLFSWYAMKESFENYVLSKWQRVECEIISSKAVEDEDSRFEVKYKYKWRDEIFEGDCYDIDCDSNDVSYSEAVELAERYKAGEQAVCYVNPDEPSEAVLLREGPHFVLYMIIPSFLLVVGGRQLYLGLKRVMKGAAALNGKGRFGEVHLETGKSSGIGAKVWKYLTVIGFIIALCLNFPLVLLVTIFLYGISAALGEQTKEMKQKLIRMELDAGVDAAGDDTIGKKVHFTVYEKAVFAIGLAVYLLIMVLIVKNLKSEDPFFLFGIIFSGLWLGLFMFAVVWMIIVMMHGYSYVALKEREKEIGFLKFDLPVWSLLVSNVAIIVWAVVERWSFYMILWVYWGQSICIGLFLFIGALVSKEVVQDMGSSVRKRKKIMKALSFLFMYVLFHLFYVLLIKGLFEDVELQTDFRLVIVFAVGIFFVQQIITFVYDSVKGGGRANIEELIGLAGLRIIPMHVTIMGAGFLSTAAGLSMESPVMLILFLGLKSFADIGMCLYARKGFSQKMEAIFD